MSEQRAIPVARVDWLGIFAFVFLTVMLTWPAEIMALVRGVRFTGISLQADLTAQLLLFAVSVMPAFAAWLVRSTGTKEGYATAGLRMGPWQYYALVWIAVPWLYIVIYGLTAVFGYGHFDPTLGALTSRLASGGAPAGATVANYLVLTVLLSLSVYIIPALVPAFGAQFGWTGYVLVKLLPLGRWPACAGYGLLWGLWQIPLAAAGYLYLGRPAGYVLIVLFTCAIGLVAAGLRIRADSIFVSTFFEAAFVTQARGVAPLVVFVAQPLLGGISGVVGIAVLAATGAWLIATTPQAAIDKILADAALPVPKRKPRAKRGR
jgi:hypothetical protein